MEVIDVDEPISVGAIFNGQKIIPRWFVRGSVKYLITNITFCWKSKQGKDEIVNFSVITPTFLSEISFNKTTLHWHLHKIITD